MPVWEYKFRSKNVENKMLFYLENSKRVQPCQYQLVTKMTQTGIKLRLQLKAVRSCSIDIYNTLLECSTAATLTYP